MRWIRFVLKFAFICNLCFILGQLLRITAYDHRLDVIVEYVLVLGVGVAFPLNLAICLITGVLLLLKKIQWKPLPPWLFLFNLGILIFQLIVTY
ncbi:hypothetical protein HF324_13365 [Chitinophaga oryzae]|uniref:Uncharacterized protein n=1 Tax=Chitinophaga oryzae TaxID=2725414 RepID=A0AAE7D8N7_9BACT|nr:hypothetical protein [Chitinophaga oryzae]QJB32328.1 hypothetical protein HF329_13730 [Chitinophaga oryzae]QJB38800.1 hypothetical protein HF324_13365 [Chitinophaga oryzae]